MMNILIVNRFYLWVLHDAILDLVQMQGQILSTSFGYWFQALLCFCSIW